MTLVSSGCLTASLGEQIDQVFLAPLDPPRIRAHPRVDGLPARIWYADATSKVWHEHRTNTFVMWDEVERRWVALPYQEAQARFSAARARIAPEGAPEEAERLLDKLVAMDPDWRGGP